MIENNPLDRKWKWPFARVDSLMSIQINFERKYFIACLTLKLFMDGRFCIINSDCGRFRIFRGHCRYEDSRSTLIGALDFSFSGPVKKFTTRFKVLTLRIVRIVGLLGTRCCHRKKIILLFTNIFQKDC